eukprot:CAMPEP_0119146460 /NCGR_PEP_ID=MMETSP1310-20130426/38925_1 /TAXON_ID=464262 /ORGANISM="Genus nov. species nov., Strain RCC2339" /LENGTH=655 /DNA_ID=CAMNT_0007138357 /DNA_START=87 /DNA_END=2051 /DNA_ORIENTATION=-
MLQNRDGETDAVAKEAGEGQQEVVQDGVGKAEEIEEMKAEEEEVRGEEEEERERVLTPRNVEDGEEKEEEEEPAPPPIPSDVQARSMQDMLLAVFNYRVRWDFSGQGEEELGHVAKGTNVQVLDSSDKEWWLILTKDGEKGFVPSKYLRKLGEEKKKKKDKGKEEDPEAKKRVMEWCNTWSTVKVTEDDFCKVEQPKEVDSGTPRSPTASKGRSRDDYLRRKELLSLPPGIAIEQYQAQAGGQVGARDDVMVYMTCKEAVAAVPKGVDISKIGVREFMKSDPDEKATRTFLERLLVSQEPAGMEQVFLLVRLMLSQPMEEIIDLDILAGGIVYAAYNCGNVMDLLRVIIEVEVRQTDRPFQIFRGNSIVTKALGEFLWIYGKDFLRQTLKPIIFAIVHSGDDFEVNPDKVADPEKLASNQQNLNASLEMTISMISNSVDRVPDIIRDVCSLIAHTVAKRFESAYSDKEDLFKYPSVRKAIINFFLFRFICPAITDPMTFQVWQVPPKEPITRRTRTALLYIAKAIHNTGQGVQFDKKSSRTKHMACMNEVIVKHSERVYSSVSSICKEHAPGKGEDIPAALESGKDTIVMKQGVDMGHTEADIENRRKRRYGLFLKKLEKYTATSRQTLEQEKGGSRAEPFLGQFLELIRFYQMK